MTMHIVSAHDPRVTDYVALTDVALRAVREPEEGLFIAEGEAVIRRAITAGYRPRSFLLAEKWLPSLATARERYPETPVFTADESTLEMITGYRVHRGALASMHRKELPSLDEILTASTRIVILEDLVDHTNVGAAFRSVGALGVDAVLVTPRCADPLYRRSVKVSMGGVFAVPWTRLPHWPAGLHELRRAGFVTMALTPSEQAMDLQSITPPERWALLLGTEGDGLSSQTLAAVDLKVRIPMAHGVDSLNVAAATAVACYALTSQPSDRPVA